MVKAAVIDVHESARFFLSGVAATVGNMLTVWLTRYSKLRYSPASLRHCDIIPAFEVLRVPLAFVEPCGRRSGEVLNRLCDRRAAQRIGW